MRRILGYVILVVTIIVCGTVLLPEAWAQGLAAPAVSVIPAAANVTEEQSFAVTVQVAAVVGAPAPTGMVELSAGNFEASAALQARGRCGAYGSGWGADDGHRCADGALHAGCGERRVLRG